MTSANTRISRPLDRHLGLEGASNFRDIGGYETADGRRVRWRRIFRSNHLGHLTDADLEQLRTIGLKRVIDFRSEGEIAQMAPNRLVEAGGPSLHINSIDPGIRPRMEARLRASGALTADQTHDIVREVYSRYIHDQTARFQHLFEHLLTDGAPLVFHCSAGKDRTGVAAALILSALGVSRDMIVTDYLDTQRFWKIDPGVSTGLPDDISAVLISVHEDFLSAAFEAVEKDFGGLDRYLASELGMGATERKHLATLYLEP